jgi:hypothetical protein
VQLFGCYAAVMDLPIDHHTYEAAERRDGEWSPLLETQLGWLREAGFESGVLHACGNYTLIAARVSA